MAFTDKDIRTIYSYSSMPDVEVEIRFGRYQYQEKKYYLSRSEFARIEKFFGDATNEYTIISRSWRGGLREDTITSKGRKKEKIYLEKRQYKFISYPQLSLDMSIASEKRVSRPRDEQMEGEPLIREKNRLEHDLGDGLLLHLTRVKQDGRTRYEVEMEITDLKRISLQILNRTVQLLLRVLSGSEIFYTQPEKQTIFKRIGSILGFGLNKYGQLPYHRFSSLKNLKVRHILSGEDNISTLPLDISLKFDGERMFFYLDTRDVYLFSPPDYLNILDVNPSTLDIPDRFRGGPLIAEGEYFPDTGTLYLYDMVVFRGKTTTQSHRDNLEYLSFLANLSKRERLHIPSLTIEVKEFYPSSSPEDLFSIADRLLSEKVDVPVDGLILTVNHTGATYKWKPIDKLSIDFLYQNGSLYTLGTGNMETLPWTNNLTLKSTKTLYNDDIIEVVINPETREATVLRVRSDKPTPNFSTVANDVWEDINNPITEGMIRGKEFGFIFRYHNRIKKALFDKFSTIRSLLDVGAGRGGDINKYPEQLDRLTLVEPSQDFREELERRLDYHEELKRKVTIIPLPFEETEIQGQYDLVSSMLSLSYLYASEEVFESFLTRVINLVKPGKYFVFFTIDGNKLQQVFNASTGTRVRDRLNLEQITFRIPDYQSLSSDNIPFGSKVLIDIPTSNTVRSQTEYVTDIDLLSAYLEENGFKQLALEDIPDEAGLNKEEKIFNTLFTWGIYQKEE